MREADGPDCTFSLSLPLLPTLGIKKEGNETGTCDDDDKTRTEIEREKERERDRERQSEREREREANKAARNEDLLRRCDRAVFFQGSFRRPE